MKSGSLLRMICLLLALWMSCSALVACRDEQPNPDQNPPLQGDTDMQVISLNGEWRFFRDDHAKSGSIKGVLASDGRDLSNGNTVEFKINVSNRRRYFIPSFASI